MADTANDRARPSAQTRAVTQELRASIRRERAHGWHHVPARVFFEAMERAAGIAGALAETQEALESCDDLWFELLDSFESRDDAIAQIRTEILEHRAASAAKETAPCG